MKRFAAIFLVIMMMLSVMNGAFASRSTYRVGDTMDDFTVQLCDGSTFTLSEALKTHDLVMINLWATWCGPCRSELPYMEEAYTAYSDKVAVVCLSVEETDTNRTIKSFMSSNGLTALPMGQDTIDLASKFASNGGLSIPTNVIVDKNRTCLYIESGAFTSTAAFKRLFDTYLSSSDGTAASSGTYRVGDTMDDFTVQLCDGSTFTLSEALKTHDLVMINLFATWCGPCRSEFPYMEEAYTAYSDRVAVVCLSVEETDTDRTIKSFMSSNGLTALPMGQDTINLAWMFA